MVPCAQVLRATWPGPLFRFGFGSVHDRLGQYFDADVLVGQKQQ